MISNVRNPITNKSQPPILVLVLGFRAKFRTKHR